VRELYHSSANYFYGDWRCDLFEVLGCGLVQRLHPGSSLAFGISLSRRRRAAFEKLSAQALGVLYVDDFRFFVSVDAEQQSELDGETLLPQTVAGLRAGRLTASASHIPKLTMPLRGFETLFLVGLALIGAKSLKWRKARICILPDFLNFAIRMLSAGAISKKLQGMTKFKLRKNHIDRKVG